MSSLVSLSKSKFFTRVELVSLVSHVCRTRVALAARVWYSCRKIDKISIETSIYT